MDTIDRESIKKQIEAISSKIKRLNDLYIDDRITIDELRKKSTEFTLSKTFLKEKLENDPILKQQESKDNIKKILSCDDILTMDYDQQKIIVKGLINKVQVTADKVIIKWKI